MSKWLGGQINYRITEYKSKTIKYIDDLKGLSVQILDVSDDELTLKLPGGKIVKIFATYSCTYSDCSAEEDPWPYLDLYIPQKHRGRQP